VPENGKIYSGAVDFSLWLELSADWRTPPLLVSILGRPVITRRAQRSPWMIRSTSPTLISMPSRRACGFLLVYPASCACCWHGQHGRI